MLVNNRWEVYDPFSGRLEMIFENVTKQGTQWWWEDAVMYGPNGDLYVYILDGYASRINYVELNKSILG